MGHVEFDYEKGRHKISFFKDEDIFTYVSSVLYKLNRLFCKIPLTAQTVYSSAPYRPQHPLFITTAFASADRSITASFRDFPQLCHLRSETHTHTPRLLHSRSPWVQKPCVGNEVVHHVKMPLYCIIHTGDKFLTSCRPMHSPNDTPGDGTWHWEWISGAALAICICEGPHFHGPPRTTLTVMLNWFPLGRAGAQFTGSQWESCGDGTAIAAELRKDC